MLPVCSAVSSSSSPFTTLSAFRDPEVYAGYSHEGGGPTRPERDTLYSPKCSENPPPTPSLKTHPMHPKPSPATARKRNYLTFPSLFSPTYLFLSLCLRNQNIFARSDLCRQKKQAHFVSIFFLFLYYNWKLSERI